VFFALGQSRIDLGSPSTSSLDLVNRFVPAAAFARLICDCDDFDVEWLEEPTCMRGCFEQHEQYHIDWYRKLFPDSCKGKSGPLLEPSPMKKAFTECGAYDVSLSCLKKKRGAARIDGALCEKFVIGSISKHRIQRKKFCTAAIDIWRTYAPFPPRFH
jgi:hypothetical protein